MCSKLTKEIPQRHLTSLFPANTYLLKVNNRNNTKRCETCAKFIIKRLRCCSDIFIVNFEHILYLFLKSILLILSK